MQPDAGMGGSSGPYDAGRLERELRAIPGVVSFGVAAGRTSLLLDAGVNVGAVKRAAGAVAARHGVTVPDLLVPASARAQRWARLPKAPIAIAGLSAAMLGSLLPLATHSLPPSPPVVLHAAPEAPAPPVVVSRGSTGVAPGLLPPAQLQLPAPSPFAQPAIFFSNPTTTLVQTIVKTVVKPVVVVVSSPAEDVDEPEHVRPAHHVPHTPNPLGHVPQGRAVGWHGAPPSGLPPRRR